MAASSCDVASPRYAWNSALAWSMAPCARPRTPSMKLWYSSWICFTCSPDVATLIAITVVQEAHGYSAAFGESVRLFSQFADLVRHALHLLPLNAESHKGALSSTTVYSPVLLQQRSCFISDHSLNSQRPCADLTGRDALTPYNALTSAELLMQTGPRFACCKGSLKGAVP